jgi:sigma-B regulation protein RsbU (phosphoserine phosphatase)
MTERHNLTALYESSRLFSTSLDLDFVLDNLLLTAMSKLLVTRGVALLFDPLTNLYEVANMKGLRALPLKSTFAFEMPSGLPWLADEQIPSELRSHKICLMLPIQSSSRHLGAIGLGSKITNEPFSLEELDFIQSLVNLSSTAVQNAVVVEELRLANRDLDRKIQQLNTLFDLATEFGSTADQSQVLKLLSFAMMGQLGIGKYAFLLRQNAEKRFKSVTAKGVKSLDFSEELHEVLRHKSDLFWVKGDPIWKPFEDRGFELLVPLQLNDETKGVLCLGKKMLGGAYSQSDIEFLTSLGQITLTSLENASLVQARIENELLAQELVRARNIQQRLLPQKIPQFNCLDMAFLAIPAQQVGGDYFELHPLDENRLLFAIADVTGKGISAALLMSNLQACLHTILAATPSISLAEATQHINRVICQNTDPDKFITFFWGVYDCRNQSLKYVNAGHDAPLLRRKNGTIERLEIGGLLLGVMENWNYVEGTIQLEPEDLLLLFTDGVSEAMNPHQEEYGMARLTHLLDTHHTETALYLHNALFDDVRLFTEGEPQSDDITAVILKVKPECIN